MFRGTDRDIDTPAGVRKGSHGMAEDDIRRALGDHAYFVLPDGHGDDFDNIREYLVEKCNLPKAFADDANGSEIVDVHILDARAHDGIQLTVEYSYQPAGEDLKTISFRMRGCVKAVDPADDEVWMFVLSAAPDIFE